MLQQLFLKAYLYTGILWIAFYLLVALRPQGILLIARQRANMGFKNEKTKTGVMQSYVNATYEKIVFTYIFWMLAGLLTPWAIEFLILFTYWVIMQVILNKNNLRINPQYLQIDAIISIAFIIRIMILAL
jgi:hypothetical protein